MLTHLFTVLIEPVNRHQEGSYTDKAFKTCNKTRWIELLGNKKTKLQ